jgi:hypothetical protein
MSLSELYLLVLPPLPGVTTALVLAAQAQQMFLLSFHLQPRCQQPPIGLSLLTFNTATSQKASLR